MDEKLRHLIEQAIQMEKDGIDFYEKLSEKVPYASGKKMILSFADDERKHLRILDEIFSNVTSIHIEEYLTESPPREKVKTVFDGAEEKIDTVSITDELSALKLAMDMEEKSYRLYEEARDIETNSNLKKLWTRLVEEEKRHYDIFWNTYDFIENPEEWILREERGLLDGG
jgi:rubrerythrin